MDNVIQVGHIEPCSHIYGPGQRFVIWVQGCTLGCKGCWNQQFWSVDGGNERTIDQLMNQILSIPGTEGITLLGGEPLQQSSMVLELIKKCKQSDLTVFLYTGYEPKEFDETMQSCFDSSDIVVTGRYVESKRDVSLKWRGSNNQVVHFPTLRYRGLEVKEAREIEIQIVNGSIKMYGYPTDEERKLVTGD